MDSRPAAQPSAISSRHVHPPARRRRSSIRGVVASTILLALLSTSGPGQSSFDVAAYRQFLDAREALTAQQLLEQHDAGVFTRTLDVDAAGTTYFASIDAVFHLTSDERQLLRRHGFVVSERLQRETFGSALTEIFHQDLPVFVSTDAILHAVHMSYDVILKQSEIVLLIPQLDSLLSGLHAQMPLLWERYGGTPEMLVSLRDVDLYLSVARSLLREPVLPYAPENLPAMNDLLGLISAESPALVRLFSSSFRSVDFSQFTVRGHYTQNEVLSRYFRSMIWLGRTELMLSSPSVDGNGAQTTEDVRRQTIDALLILEAIEEGDLAGRLSAIDEVIRRFVGESDNVTVAQLADVRASADIDQASALLDSMAFARFQSELAERPFAGQRIMSQIFITDPLSPEQVRLPSAFLLLGQRFVIDSYVMSQVVYDRIVWRGEKVRRMLPSPLDVLFALGNNAAGQLLRPEMEQYPYGRNLAALRYLVDHYDGSFWTSTFANAWLSSIRSLNPPRERAGLPAFMRTAAWWQQKMNTQIASWAQLRHDNLLYAKQSYSAGVVCSYPESYVEPIPEFYASIRRLAESGASICEDVGLSSGVDYFISLKSVAEMLETIALKTLEGTPLSEDERTFLRGMLRPPDGICGSPWGGWYTGLFYEYHQGPFKANTIVADVHTAPTDEAGNAVGWVLHVGTGNVNMAVVTANHPNVGMATFIGPVMSAYEYVSTGFHRLTDEEWTESFSQAPARRFPFTALYLADAAGALRPAGPELITGVAQTDFPPSTPSEPWLSECYPNPFNPSAMLEFSVPDDGRVTIVVYDLLGRRVEMLFDGDAPGGRALRIPVQFGTKAGGMYVARMTWNGRSLIRKMILAK